MSETSGTGLTLPNLAEADVSDLRVIEVIDISVVMPCLNEEASVGICVRKAWEGISRTGLHGEVIVADNGSIDRSVEVAKAAGARVVHQGLRGYGNAYLKGFDAARGSIVVMGDSDDSYDFTTLLDLIAPLQTGFDYVLGSRFSGQIRRGAMTWSHRYVGNPALTALLNIRFGLKVTDAHSGFRAFTQEALKRMDLRCQGMEFASELVVKAAQAGLRVAEIPIIYHPRIGKSKLNSLKDGWRHIRFLTSQDPVCFICSPRSLDAKHRAFIPVRSHRKCRQLSDSRRLGEQDACRVDDARAGHRPASEPSGEAVRRWEYRAR